METLFEFVQSHAEYAHWVIFGLLILAALNFPISEDVVIIFSAVLASSVIPQNTVKIFLGLFLGAYLSDLLVYWMGRTYGPYLWRLKWFARFFPPQKMQQIAGYYEKHGVLTLFVGRFIPFGVRNCLFITAGIGKMPFQKFMIADGLACLLSNTTLFCLAYICGKNFSNWMKYINIGIFIVFFIALIGFVWYKRKKVSADALETPSD